jgi:hypothetical protein
MPVAYPLCTLERVSEGKRVNSIQQNFDVLVGSDKQDERQDASLCVRKIQHHKAGIALSQLVIVFLVFSKSS